MRLSRKSEFAMKKGKIALKTYRSDAMVLYFIGFVNRSVLNMAKKDRF